MRNVTLTHSIRQMSLVLAGFLAAIVLLESDGLASWAIHLEIGSLRTVAVPVTGAVAKALRPLGLVALRQGALNNLARVGWTDDAALEAAAVDVPRKDETSTVCGAPGLAKAPGSGLVAAAGSAPGKAASRPRIDLATAAGANSPLLSDLPRVTTLAPLPPVELGRPRVVALAGDSMMAVGLSATLLRQAAGNKNLRMVRAFRSGTGLARPEVFNWMDEYPAMLGAEKPDVVIVAIGANDGQGFVVDGKVMPYGSADWRRVYQERLAGYLAMVGAGGARVVWVGLPPMRLPIYDEKIAAINRIAYTVVSQSPQATWWNPVSYVGDQAGKFREFADLGNGKTMRLRAADGIHLSDEGAGLLTTVLMKWLDPPPPVTSGTVQAAQAPAPPAVRPKRRVRRAVKG